MTEDFGEPPGSGPGGLVLPEDLDLNDDPEAPALLAKPAYRGSPEQRMERVEALLASLDRKVQGRLETGERILETVERAEDEWRSGFLVLRGKMSDLLCDVVRVSRVPEDMATRHCLEDVARRQQNEFAFLRECHAWLRGAVTVGLPEQSGRSGVFAWCVLWAIATLAALAAGAVALGFVSVNVSWTGPVFAQTASVVRPAPPRLDVAPAFVEPPPLLEAPDPNSRDVVPLVGMPPGPEETWHIDAVPGPGDGIVEAPPFALPREYLRELNRLDERRAREAVDAKPFPEGGPGEVEPPLFGKTGEEGRMGRGPEEYVGRREDSRGLHPDVPMDAAP